MKRAGKSLVRMGDMVDIAVEMIKALQDSG